MIEQLRFSARRRLPLILQTEVTECGLACVAMIAGYFGHQADLNYMRQRFSVSLKGATLETLMSHLASLSLGARAIRVEMDAIANIQTPAILHWDLDHYVVLKKVTRGTIHIHDPAYGRKVLSHSEFSSHFTGVALEVTPTQGFEKLDAREKLRLTGLWGKLVGLKVAITQLLVLSAVLQLLGLASPLYLQIVVDEILVKHDVDLLYVLTVGFLGLALLQSLTSFVRSFALLHYSNQISFQLVTRLFTHLAHLPVGYFEKRHIGDILSRLESTGPIQSALSESVVAAVMDGVMSIVTGVVIFIYSPFLALLIVGAIFINLLLNLGFYPLIRRSQEALIVAEANESTYMMETIRGATTIKLFTAESRRLASWRNLFAEKMNRGIVHGKYEIYLGTLQGIVNAVQGVLVVYFGATIILEGSSGFTIGMLFAFMAFSGNFSGSLNALIGKIIEFRLLGLHLERISDIVRTEAEKDYSVSKRSDAHVFRGEIELRDVGFRYSEADPWVFEHVNLTIPPGEHTVLVGPSGGGKTTLLKLILGLYTPSAGEIVVDGERLVGGFNQVWRNSIGVVMQDDQLMSGTLSDNISFFAERYDEKRVIEAAKRACIHDEVMAMPMKYLSMVGDMGSALSAGQKQRILLARAFYRHPQALFLDEGTANIDENTERQIVDVVSSLDYTRLIVAHRPEFIARADYTIVVADGQVKPLN